MADVYNYVAEIDFDNHGISKGYSTTADEICFRPDYLKTELAKDLNECVQRASPYIDEFLDLNYSDSIVNDCTLAETFADDFNDLRLNSEDKFESLNDANSSNLMDEYFVQENEPENSLLILEGDVLDEILHNSINEFSIAQETTKVSSIVLVENSEPKDESSRYVRQKRRGRPKKELLENELAIKNAEKNNEEQEIIERLKRNCSSKRYRLKKGVKIQTISEKLEKHQERNKSLQVKYDRNEQQIMRLKEAIRLNIIKLCSK